MLEIAVELDARLFDRVSAQTLGFLLRSFRIRRHSGFILVLGIVALAERFVKTIVGIAANRISIS